MRKALVLALVAVGLVFATACEPTMTITATGDKVVGCGDNGAITGTVAPKTATGKVYLQRTVNGQWRDFTQTVLDVGTETPWATVTKTGAYKLYYVMPMKAGTYHFRVRSSGGGSFSPGVYVEGSNYDTNQCSS